MSEIFQSSGSTTLIFSLFIKNVLIISITMNSLLKFIKTTFKNIIFTVVGATVVTVLFISILFNIPIYAYRWTVCKVIAPFFNRKLGKALNLHGSAIAFELIRKHVGKQPRCTIVTNLCLEGSINFEDLQNRVLNNWIFRKDDSGNLRYPEFQQYIKGYLGYLFFKNDKSFDIKNHLKKHVIDKTCSEEDCEGFVCSLTETILNKTYTPRRSPWSIDVIYNYRNSEILQNGQEMTVIIFSWHHCLMDGFAAFSAILEGLFDIPLSSCLLATPKKTKKQGFQCCSKLISSIINFTTFPVRAVRDIGFSVYLLGTVIQKTPWHISEDERSGKMHYCRSGIIPIEKLKRIKNKFGVTFTSVLLSSMSAGIGDAFKHKNFEISKIPFGVALPIKTHSEKLRNQVTGTIFEIPVRENLAPVERLKKAEKLFKFGRESTLPYLAPILMKLTMVHIYPLGRLLYKNYSFSTSCSNFPGSSLPLSCNEYKLLTKDFGCGLLPGVAGVGFMILSYNGHIRIVVTAENAAMERSDVEKMIKRITNEIDHLYNLALSADQNYRRVGEFEIA